MSTREQAELARAKFLQELRARVSWQADAADRLRQGLPAQDDANVVPLRRRERDEPKRAS